MMDGFGDDGTCFQPCSQMSFDSRLTRVDAREDKFGMFIQLEDVVKVQRSSFVIDSITLMTRVGGIIGVGKEFLWAIVIGFYFLHFLSTIIMKTNQIKKYIKPCLTEK